MAAPVIPKGRLIIIGIILLVIVLGVVIYIFGARNPGDRPETVELNFWGVFDRSDVINQIASGIPGFEVSYREFDPQTYEAQLIDALAAGRGPDVFMIHSSWLPKHFNKLAPVSELQLSLETFRNLFPTVVEQDFAPDSVIYALPLYLDTLALFYNRDVFDSEAVAAPPKTWLEFQNLVPQLRKLDASGKLIRAAAAIGGSNRNINRATDVLAALMLQSGVKMVSADGLSADFARSGGLETLSFYTKFANPASEFFTWNEDLPNSVDAFAQGTAAMMINYAHQIPVLKAKNPFLNFRLAPLPKPSGAQLDLNYANYWGLAVSNSSLKWDYAWNFALSFTADPTVVQNYIQATNRLPALKSLIDQKRNDPEFGVFAKAALSARSWPQVDNVQVERIFSKMIEDVVSGRAPAGRAIKEAEDAISELMAQRRS